jgi:hypothetical protein
VTHSAELASLPLSERINRLIEAAGSQEGLAVQVGAAVETVNRWANYHARPGREYRKKLAGYGSRVFGEELSPELFREYISLETQAEGAVDQLIRTGRGLQDATQALILLLAEQRDVVGRLARLEAALERQVAALEERQGSR